MKYLSNICLLVNNYKGSLKNTVKELEKRTGRHRITNLFYFSRFHYGPIYLMGTGLERI